MDGILKFNGRDPAERRTLLIGALSDAEAAALGAMRAETTRWRRAARWTDALAELAARPYERVVLAQARPGELPSDAPHQVRNLRPDVELLSIAGAWCEGELRTGKPWEDVPRVYWHQAPTWLNDATAPAAAKPLVEVATRSYESVGAWADALDALGYASVWSPRGRAPAMARRVGLAIWDGDQLDGLEADALGDFCRERRAHGCPAIAVFDFPRGDAALCAQSIGASCVIGRPWTLESVTSAIDTALGRDARGHPFASISPLADAVAA